MNSITVQAAVATAAASPFQVDALELRAPTANELRVRIVATSVCHTDVMTKDKGLCAFPIVLGHEGVGVVDAIGKNVGDFDIGDHVVLSYDSCGDCPQCDNGKPSYCDHHGSLNFSGIRPDGNKTHAYPDSDTADVYGSFFQQSSFASYALAHPSNTIKVDKSLPLATLAPLGCGVQTGAGTVFNTLQVETGSTIAIFGCGCVGLSAVMAANVAGAKNVIAIDINPERLAMATELGADQVLNPRDFANAAALVAHIQTSSGIGGCHYTIDTTGNPTVLRQAFDCCRPMGVTAMIAPGVPGTEVTVEMLGLLPGKSLRGVVQGDSVSKTFIPKLIDLWQQGRFPFERLITFYSGIEAIETAANDMSKGSIIKPVVVLDHDFVDNEAST